MDVTYASVFELIGIYFTELLLCLMPLPGVLALHAILHAVTKRGTWWFLRAADLLACPLAVLSWFMLGDDGKSLVNLIEMIYPCWLWSVFILIRSILNLCGVKLNARKWAIGGCVVLIVVVVLAHMFTPGLPE